MPVAVAMTVCITGAAVSAFVVAFAMLFGVGGLLKLVGHTPGAR